MKKFLVLLVFLFTMLSTYNIVAQEKWQLQNSNFPANVTVTNFSPVNDLVCWAGGWIISQSPYPGYIRTIDGGNTWVCDSIPGIPDGVISQVFAIDADTAYVAVYVMSASDSKGIYKTTDGGNTWTKQNAYLTAFYGPGYFYFFDASNGVVIGDPNLETYTTTNGGQTWNPVSMQALYGEYTIVGTGIAGYGNSVWFYTTHRMFRSTDRGNTWTASPYDPQYYFWYPCIAFQDENIGISSLWEFGLTSKIYRKTTNGGSTWTDFSNSVLNNLTPTSIIHIPGTTATYLVSDGTGSTRGSALTYDAGENWILLDTDNFGCWTIGFSSDSSGWGSIRYTNQVYKYIGPPYPVPVELTSFTATANGKVVILNWTTSTETNNQGFEIERASSSTTPLEEDWKKIGFVPGFGTTTEPKSYSYSDQSVNTGINYYRLKQIDYDGSYEYSDVVEIEISSPTEFMLLQNFPNPFNPTTTIGFGLQNKSNVRITILNAIGEEVAVVLNEEKEPGFHQVEFSAANLPSGVYFYRLNAGSFVETKKILLLK
jgi:photosystem II stability/assembly factor-like uncharacterized protein